MLYNVVRTPEGGYIEPIEESPFEYESGLPFSKALKVLVSIYRSKADQLEEMTEDEYFTEDF